MGKMSGKIAGAILSTLTGRRILYPVWERLHFLSLMGMNVGGGSDFEKSGELRVLEEIRKVCGDIMPVLFDVGANVGDYALRADRVFGGEIDIYAFEPSRVTFEKMVRNTKERGNIRSFNFGFGEEEAEVVLYTDAEGSGLASVFKRNLDHLDIHMDRAEKITVRKIDDFCRESGIKKIHFLKIDVEGNELAVLKGAKEMIAAGAIDRIQFEFGGTNIDARTFFRDFFLYLSPHYALYRVLKDGLAPIPKYQETLEIFTTTNFLAISIENLDFSK